MVVPLLRHSRSNEDDFTVEVEKYEVNIVAFASSVRGKKVMVALAVAEKEHNR